MIKDNKLLYSVVILVVFFVLAGWTSVFLGLFAIESAVALTVGGLITTSNFLLGIYSLSIANKRSEQMFVAIFFGGMIIRLALLLTAVLISLTVLELKQNSFIFSIFIFYILYLITEIVHLIFKRH